MKVPPKVSPRHSQKGGCFPSGGEVSRTSLPVNAGSHGSVAATFAWSHRLNQTDGIQSVYCSAGEDVSQYEPARLDRLGKRLALRSISDRGERVATGRTPSCKGHGVSFGVYQLVDDASAVSAHG